MSVVAPNLTALIGENVGSKLIAHSGSLVNLAKYPASTIQILGAEKALFRALKTKGKTPKYGLIFNSTYIGRAGTKNKGRISRYLANKCAIASRLDSFSVEPNSKFGEKLREQMEERLLFLSTGTKPKKNSDAMREVLQELKNEGLYYEGKVEEKPKAQVTEKKRDQKAKSKAKAADSDSEEEVKPAKGKAKAKAKPVDSDSEEEVKPAKGKAKAKAKPVDSDSEEEVKPKKGKAKTKVVESSSESEEEKAKKNKKKRKASKDVKDQVSEQEKPKKKKKKVVSSSDSD